MWRCGRGRKKGIKLKELSFRFGEEGGNLFRGWPGVGMKLGENFGELGGGHCERVGNGRCGLLLDHGSDAECRFQA